MSTAKRKHRTRKFQVSALRKGTLEFATAYTAREAAQQAVKFAKRGFTVEVQRWSAGAKRKHVAMTCIPVTVKGKVVARCTPMGAFKKQARGLAGRK